MIDKETMAQLRKELRRGSIGKIAKASDVSSTAVSQVLAGKSTSEKIELQFLQQLKLDRIENSKEQRIISKVEAHKP